MDPDDFVKWVFPKLLDYRKNKYETIAENYGYKISASEIGKIQNEEDFMSLISKAMKD
jgi:hypothetical protein